jgi:type I restriction enzyme M protein
MNFHATEERIQRLREETGFQNLAKSKKRDPQDKAEQEAEGRALQEQIIKMLGDLPDVLYKNRPEFMKVLKATAKKHDIKLNSVLNKAILSALGEKDETADICKDKDGNPEADSDLRDYEYVPLEADTDYWEDPLSYESVPLKQNIHDYFQREVVPFMPEAWINIGVTDPADGEIGKVGYEINFNRYFYKYQPPRPLEEIESDLKQLEAEILEMLQEVTE